MFRGFPVQEFVKAREIPKSVVAKAICSHHMPFKSIGFVYVLEVWGYTNVLLSFPVHSIGFAQVSEVFVRATYVAIILSKAPVMFRFWRCRLGTVFYCHHLSFKSLHYFWLWRCMPAKVLHCLYFRGIGCA